MQAAVNLPSSSLLAINNTVAPAAIATLDSSKLFSFRGAQATKRCRTNLSPRLDVCRTSRPEPAPYRAMHLRIAVPTVRIHLPPADSPSLSRSRFWRSRTPAFRAGVRGWLGDRVGRDAQGFPLHANPWVYLCRTIFQYRSTADVVARMPRWSQQSWVFSVL